jgi:DMSO/TMAO reductase YedYZ molybdopterin-dependent catalytic subunit
MTDLDRRLFLGRAGLAALPLIGGARLLGDTAPKSDKRIVQSKEPLNLEMPIGTAKEFLTPTELHYVRNHYAMPKLDAKSYRLVVTGAVKRELRVTLDYLQKLKSATRAVTLECAGNGRSLLKPKVKGVQWGLGAVSTAEWAGVPLAALLDLAGVQPGAVEVILDGADKGDPKKEIQPPYDITFCRSLPLAKATSPETMLAWGMNGKDLRPEHGYPLRAVVAGWYGMASVKWLTRIIVTKAPFNGFDQTIDYGIWAKGEDGLPRLTPVTAIQVKSSITSPAPGDSLPINKEVRIHGATWAGESEVAKVEISTNGGKAWVEAKLLGKPVPYCWRQWEHRWTPTAAGEAVLMVRATDRGGRTQPLKHDPSRRNYMISFVQSTPVTVRS